MEPQSHAPRNKFLDLPLELHLNIVTELSTIYDVEQLGLTCRYIRTVLLSIGGPALRKVGIRSMYAFEECLRVTRAKMLPISTLRRFFHFDTTKGEYTNPPHAAFFEDLASSPPSLVEASKMLRLQAIASTWEMEYMEFSKIRDQWIGSVREAFYRGAYRSMLHGAVFSQAYLYPLHLVQQAYRVTPQSLRPGIEIARYPPFHTKDEFWYHTQMEKLYAGFGEWLAVDGTRRPTIPALLDSDRQFRGRTKDLTVSERGALTEIMLLFSLADDDFVDMITSPQEEPQDFEDDNYYSSVVKLYTDGGTAEIKYIVYDSGQVSQCKFKWVEDYSWDLYYSRADYEDGMSIIADFANGGEIEFIQAVLKHTLGLQLRDLGIWFESPERQRSIGHAFLEAGHVRVADYYRLLTDASAPA